MLVGVHCSLAHDYFEFLPQFRAELLATPNAAHQAPARKLAPFRPGLMQVQRQFAVARPFDVLA